VTQQLGRYQLTRKLATGGMAEVFLAKAAGPMGFEKTLVLKRILPHLAEEPAFVEMFLSEAKLAAQLTHPHIVQIFDFGEADGAYFLAMEYIDGPNLRVLGKRASAQGVSPPPALCARIIANACEGLAFAHDFVDPDTGEPLGLIHRDISPDNILVSRQGAVKVVDFGIAKAAGQSHRTQSGVIKGKLAYMPPEQVRSKPLDRRVDVYALGVVLYELLTAHKPFAADADVGLMQAILFEPMTPAAHHRPELPESLLRILDKALAKDREQRYPDCLALQSDLEDFILSVGRPVKTQQLAQYIAQVIPGTDNPQPTPRASAPPGGPKPTVTPMHTPSPVSMRTDTSDFRAPEDAAELATSPYLPSEETRPQEVPPPLAPEVTRVPAPSGKGSGKRNAIVGGTVLLGLVAAVVLWRSGPAPAPQDVPVSAPAPEQAATPPTPPAQAPPPQAPPAQAALPQEEPAAPLAQRPAVPEKSEPVIAAPPPTTRPSRPARAPVAPKSTAKGTLELRVRPYAIVFVDGKKLGDTPLPPTPLSVGRYTVKLVNPDIPKTVTRVVEVKADQTTLLKLNFAEE